MARKSLADRLQAGLEMVPLDKRTPEQFAAAYPPRFGPNAKPWVRRLNLIMGIFILTVVAVATVSLVISGIVWTNWWNTKTSLVCTIDDMDSYEEYGKTGYDHTVFDVYTTTCGDLQIMPGAGRNDRETIAFANTLQVGATYELDVRGWDGWLGNLRAVAGAKLLNGPQ